MQLSIRSLIYSLTNNLAAKDQTRTKQRLLDTDNNVVVARGKASWGAAKGKGGQIFSDERRLDFEW